MTKMSYNYMHMSYTKSLGVGPNVRPVKNFFRKTAMKYFSIWSFYRACTGLLAVDAIKKPVGAHSVKYNIRTVAIISAPTLQVLAEMRAKVRPFDVLCPDRYPLLYMMIRLFRLLLPG